ncbi:MAG: hypothetical protein M1113_04810 [Candidatus Thermoplasmatota archaeon]|nr:hypothetical protein [Candidatus Thermoplasmatota archaeon]
MSDLTIVALLFSIIAIVLWIITFLKSRSVRPQGNTQPMAQEVETSRSEAGGNEAMVPQVKSSAEVSNRDEEFFNDLSKFTQMVRKNLEMINTRIGIKFDIKPLVKRDQKKTEQNYVPSMDVSDQAENTGNEKQQ